MSVTRYDITTNILNEDIEIVKRTAKDTDKINETIERTSNHREKHTLITRGQAKRLKEMLNKIL